MWPTTAWSVLAAERPKACTVRNDHWAQTVLARLEFDFRSGRNTLLLQLSISLSCLSNIQLRKHRYSDIDFQSTMAASNFMLSLLYILEVL